MANKEINRSIRRYWLVLGLILTITTLVGCATSQSNVDKNTVPAAVATVVLPSGTSAPSVMPTQMVTVTSSPSTMPTSTATITSSPSAVPTATYTPAPTLTPLPTISPQQRGQVYANLMSNNGDCPLPCWWGFEPGVTSIDEVRQLYTAFGTYISEQTDHNEILILEATFVDPQIEQGIQVNHTFIAQDGIVIEALIDVDDANYQIEPLLQRLGPPSEVWMWTIPEPYEGILPTRFRLYFPEQGVFVLYATAGEEMGDAVHVCFDGLGGATLLLWDPTIWDPDRTKSIVDRANEGGSAFTLEGYPIDEVSNWNAEQFYIVLSDPTHSECLETPSNLWPAP